MKKYIIYYYNRFANENQTFKVMAENKYRAGRIFYLKYNRKAYHDCIENIIEVEHEHYWTKEEILNALNKKNKKDDEYDTD